MIGCGSIANERHASEYHQHPNVELFLVYDPNPDPAQELVAKYGYASYPLKQASDIKGLPF
ncbi:hypothetical protein ACFVS2_06040 [Brevibacillus sp. NPDC058079]|uniref:hypothetical protein n=1 Tax=Brevibacillus sp. NPDC058079 TaxID=3346330 RepID=UPI0036DFD0C9